MSTLLLHFDGQLAKDNRVSMRTLGKSIIHLQNAYDRAFIEQHYGELWKHARMKSADYQKVELLYDQIEIGSFRITFKNLDELIELLTRRIRGAVQEAFEADFEEGDYNLSQLKDQAIRRKEQIQNGAVFPVAYDESTILGDNAVVRRYGDRAIVREINQALATVRSKSSGDSTIGFEFGVPNSTMEFHFDREAAVKFNKVVSRRTLGEPIIYTGRIEGLSKRNLKGEVTLNVTGKTCNLWFADETALNKVIPGFEGNLDIIFYGSPILEYGAFDPEAGDVFFVDILV
ncbi:MAG: hypothetical protein ACOY3E_18290 [Pseudomonadota bacterium]